MSTRDYIPPAERTLKRGQVAVRLGVASGTVDGWRHSGALKAVRKGRGYVYLLTDVQAFEAKRNALNAPAATS